MNLLKKGFLKDMIESDLPMVLAWRNQDFVRNMMYNSEIITMKQHKNWFKNLEEKKNSIAKVFYFEGRPYGVVHINHIDYDNGKCEWGFYIGEKDAPQGLGMLMGYIAINYIFNQLNIRKLYAEVLNYNDKSYHFHKKLGFDEEGHLKEHFRKKNQYIDVIIFGLLKSNWLDHSNEIFEKVNSNIR